MILETERLAAQIAEYNTWSVNRLLNCGRADILGVVEKHKYGLSD